MFEHRAVELGVASADETTTVPYQPTSPQLHQTTYSNLLLRRIGLREVHSFSTSPN